MKIFRFLFAMIVAAGLLHGTSLARQSNSSTQHTSSQKAEQSTSDQLTNGEVRGEKAQTRSAQADEGTRALASASRTAKHRSQPNSFKPVSTNPAAPAKTPTTNNHRSGLSGSVAAQHQTRLKVVTDDSSRAASHRSVPTPPSTVALNGQQFRSSRGPGSHLATAVGR